jgi:uncharacterized cupredoxin-like copper-binding protein
MTGTVRRGLALIAIGSLLVSCSGATSGPVSATLKEWQITLSSTNLKAGTITFNVTNDGTKNHEFIVRKTDLKVDALPLFDSGADAGRINEEAPELSTVGDPSEIADFAPGLTKSLTVTLQPGHYVIFCNLKVETLLHYSKGMRIDFTVT